MLQNTSLYTAYDLGALPLTYKWSNEPLLAAKVTENNHPHAKWLEAEHSI